MSMALGLHTIGIHFSYFNVTAMYIFYSRNRVFLPIWTELELTGILEWIVNRCVEVYFS